MIDTGPLVAYLVREEQNHAWAVEHFGMLPPPLLTCEAVVTEAAYLLAQTGSGTDALFEMIARGVVKVAFDLNKEIEPVRHLMRRYRNVPMSLADACLVRMAEIHEKSIVFTLDSDFTFYRKHSRHVIATLRPPSK